MKRKSTSDFSTILSSLCILLLVVGVVGFLFVWTESFTTPLKNFSIKCGNDDFYSDRENFDIVLGKQYKFEINSNILNGTQNKKYFVSIVPNETSATSFMYTVDGVQYNFASLESLAKGFSISVYDDYFVLVADSDLQDILQMYYQGQTIGGVPTAIDSNLPYFRLVIQNGNLTETININFNLKREK